MLAYLALRRVRVVHLVRTNVFDAMLSWEVNRARGFAGARNGESPPPVSVRLDPAEIRARLEEHSDSLAAARARVASYRLSCLDVYYEELVARHTETLEAVLRFLDVAVTTERLRSTFAPIDDVPREDVVENLDEVRSALAGTRFEWMLDRAFEAPPVGA
jgi:LPS sulfotransferase NodH